MSDRCEPSARGALERRVTKWGDRGAARPGPRGPVDPSSEIACHPLEKSLFLARPRPRRAAAIFFAFCSHFRCFQRNLTRFSPTARHSRAGLDRHCRHIHIHTHTNVPRAPRRRSPIYCPALPLALPILTSASARVGRWQQWAREAASAARSHAAGHESRSLRPSKLPSIPAAVVTRRYDTSCQPCYTLCHWQVGRWLLLRHTRAHDARCT